MAGMSRMITCQNRVYLPFALQDQRLHCDGVSLEAIVQDAGTPVYVYSARAIREAYHALEGGFASRPRASRGAGSLMATTSI